MTCGCPQAAFHAHPDTEEMARALAAEIAARLTRAVARDGAATLAVSGGGTPRLLYRRLAHEKAPWQQITVTLADERWVDPASPDSNEHLVRETLLSDEAAEARFVGLKTADTTPEAAAPRCNRRAAELARPFEIVLLGMGEDGHTASLFPGVPRLEAALDPDTPDTYMPIDPQGATGAASLRRLSMTLAGLLDSRLILLLIAGKAKREVYESALAGADAAAMPVRAVLRQRRVPVEVHWAP